MFRQRQPLRKYVGALLTHSEVRNNGKGLERVEVSDCDKLPPVDDFDLDLNIAAGENLNEVSSILMNRGTVNVAFKETTKTEKKETTKTEKPVKENEDEK